jgi:hypothetical protein
LPYPHFYGIYERMMLEEEVDRLRTENQELKQLVAHLLEQLAAAQQRIAELEQQHTDPPPFVKPNRPKSADPKPKRKKRAPHHNHGRKRMTPTCSVEHTLERCPDCDYRLQGHSLDYSREVLELPERDLVGRELLAQIAVEPHVGLAQQHPDADRGRPAETIAATFGRACQRLSPKNVPRIDDHKVPYDMIPYENCIRGNPPDA